MIVKNYLLALCLLMFSTSLCAEENIYEGNCVPCHRFLPLEGMFMTYLKTYSGKYSVIGSLKAYLKNPTEDTSLMTPFFIDNFSVKDKTKLSNKDLDKALEIYWNLYDVRNKLR